MKKQIGKYLSRASFQTFIVDPPLLIIGGAAVFFLAAKVFKKQKLVFWLCCVIQLTLWIIGGLMYFDWPFFAVKGLGNDFMWNGYINQVGLIAMPKSQIPTYNNLLWNFLALIGWLIQPLSLYLGVRLGKFLIKKT